MNSSTARGFPRVAFWFHDQWDPSFEVKVMAKEAVSGAARNAPSRLPPSSGTTKPSGNASSKARVSDRLEEDAQAMEERLIQLRSKILEDKRKLEKELPAKFGGSRWRSAQEGIGSVSRYAKDVEQRMGKDTKQAKTINDSNFGSSEKQEKAKKKKRVVERYQDQAVVPSVATVKKWKSQNVLEWLSSLGQDEFHPAFEYHQVTGVVLLELTIEEIAQIGVNRMSARNLIWAELERIKGAGERATQRGASEPTEIIDPKIRDIPVVPEVASPEKEGRTQVHWSHVQPFRDRPGGQSADVPVNLADGEFNEDESHASFMKALLDWRAGDNDAKSEEPDDELWFNPTTLTENNNHEPSPKRGGALLHGVYDEAKEQEAFRKAVMSWRHGTATEGKGSRPPTAEVQRIEQACDAGERKSCWQCYRIVRADELTTDVETKRAFCRDVCKSAFNQEYSRLYSKKAAGD